MKCKKCGVEMGEGEASTEFFNGVCVHCFSERKMRLVDTITEVELNEEGIRAVKGKCRAGDLRRN